MVGLAESAVLSYLAIFIISMACKKKILVFFLSHAISMLKLIRGSVFYPDKFPSQRIIC